MQIEVNTNKFYIVQYIYKNKCHDKTILSMLCINLPN